MPGRDIKSGIREIRIPDFYGPHGGGESKEWLIPFVDGGKRTCNEINTTLFAKIVAIKEDRGAIWVFKFLLRLKGLTEEVGINHLKFKDGEGIKEIRVKIDLAVLFDERNGDITINNLVVFLGIAGLGAAKEDVAAGVDGQMHIVKVAKGLVFGHCIGELREIGVVRGIAVIGLGACNEVEKIQTVIAGAPGIGGVFLTDWLLDKDVVVEPGISVQDGHKAVDLGAVRNVVGRVSRSRILDAAVVGALTDHGEGTGNQVVHKGKTLGGKTCGNR